MNNQITQNEKIVLDLTTNTISSHLKKFKEKGIALSHKLNTSQDDPHESKITIDLLFDDEILEFIEFSGYEKGEFIKDTEAIKKLINEKLNKIYQDLIQYE